MVKGPSGAGKTTLLHVLAGLLEPNEGEVRLDDQDLKKLSNNQKTALRDNLVGLVFQRLNLIDHLTALENIRLVLGTGKADKKRAEDALDKLFLSHRQGTVAAKLSLGEQQRVAVARALVKSPCLILADEPTSSLDGPNKDAVMHALFAAQTAGATLLVVSHDDRLEKDFEKSLTLQSGGLS